MVKAKVKARPQPPPPNVMALKAEVVYLNAALREALRQRGPGRTEKCFTCRQPFQIYPGDTPRYMLPRGGMPVCPDCWKEALHE